VPAVRQYQVVHDETGLHARVVLSGDTTDDICEQLRRRLADAIASVGAVVPPIEVQRVDAIERQGGIGAKYKLVESRIRSV
jgi:hypothetical protein